MLNERKPEDEQSMDLNLISKNSKMPHPKPNAALEPVIETDAQTNITNESCFEFMSFEAMANSIPAKSRSTPRIPIGNSFNILTKELPNNNPRTSFPIPRKITDAPLRPPKRYWPARPPAP